MKNDLMTILKFSMILLCSCGYYSAVHAEDSADQLLEKALWEYRAIDGTTSAFHQRLVAIVKQHPTHPRALWHLVFHRYNLHQGLNGNKIRSRAETLAAAGPAVLEIAKYAREQGDHAFGYYILARYSSLYHAFDQAILNIEKALIFKPKTPRYLRTKARILIRKGQWDDNNEMILEGMHLLETVLKLVEKSPSVHINPGDAYFELAYANTVAKQDPQKTIEYYHARLKYDDTKSSLAIAWSNLSKAYRGAGECVKAQEAAETSLGLHKSKRAKKNLRYAQFCRDMQIMGIHTVATQSVL
jgi:tetratricopeptide (TPR) repeat protein